MPFKKPIWGNIGLPGGASGQLVRFTGTGSLFYHLGDPTGESLTLWVMSPGGQSNLLLIRRLLHPSIPDFDPIRHRFFARVLPKFSSWEATVENAYQRIAMSGPNKEDLQPESAVVLQSGGRETSAVVKPHRAS